MSAAPNQGNTVTLAVVQGESPNPTATFSQAMAARQVVVGSGPAGLAAAALLQSARVYRRLQSDIARVSIDH